ncbi:MAG: small multi-drug export protein [Lachnospiraceae bacterium]|nr:small multi-drug export protein [Lachnospiraceae bacterium]
MESLVQFYENSLGSWMPREVFIFLVSMVPLVELRGGLVIAKLLDVGLLPANLICIIGNIVPIPFILLFIRRIFEFMKKHNILKKLVLKLEERAAKKSKGAERGEFIFLLTFVGIPIPGTGAWTGSLIASLFKYDIKKASLAIFLGIIMAAIIMDILSYGLLGLIIH